MNIVLLGLPHENLFLWRKLSGNVLSDNSYAKLTNLCPQKFKISDFFISIKIINFDML